jgi:hypothetical protein
MISDVWWLLAQLLDRIYMMTMYAHRHEFFGSNVLLVSKSQFSNIVGIDWLVTFGLLAAAIMALVAVDKIVLKLMKHR